MMPDLLNYERKTRGRAKKRTRLGQGSLGGTELSHEEAEDSGRHLRQDV